MTPSALRTPALGLLRTALVTLLAGYAAMSAALYLRQADLIFPGARTRGTRDVEFDTPEGTELVRLPTADGSNVAALWAPAVRWPGEPKLGPSRATLLYFYGNGMCLADARGMVSRLQGLGADVLAVEYPGYGLNSGRASERGCYAAADAAYDYLIRQKSADPKRLIPIGTSLGGGVALDLASRRAVGGVITLSTFTSIADVAAPQFPQFPVRALLQHRFESKEKIGRIRTPLLLIHGNEDHTVPFRMRDELASAASGPVTRYDVEGGWHSNLFERDEKGVLDAIDAFIAALP